MVDAISFEKLLKHPEKNKIIAKLVSGDPPKVVSEYLKIKYDSQDEAHLRLPINLLNEFKNKYLDKYKFLDKLIKDEQAGKIDKKVFQSLLNNKEWRERIAEYADKEIDLKKDIQQLIWLIRARTEQVFDQIQTSPSNFKGDYVLIKYFDTLLDAMEKADKIINERPDTLIQNNISIQMIEQHSVAFQEAIRQTLTQLNPDEAARFMELLNENLSKIQPQEELVIKTKPLEKRTEEVKQLVAAKIIEVENDL